LHGQGNRAARGSFLNLDLGSTLSRVTDLGNAKGSGNLTLEQIGKRAGVSRSTVSRVLNEHPDVRPEVRARVEGVIEETGYQPNPAARALVSRRSGLIGLVMLTDSNELFGDPYYSALVTGIHQGCAEHGVLFAIFPVHGPGGGSDALTPQIAQGFVDGVIVTAGPGSDRLIGVLRDRGKPMIVVGHPVDDARLSRIDVENRVGSDAAVTHLLEHGRHRIGFVGATEQYLYGVERLDGYRDALARAGVEFDDRLVRLDEPTSAGGERATASLLADLPDAIHVSTDPMAQGAYRALHDRGLRIPDDVAIVGFDGLPRGPQLEPALTTVVQPVVEVGRTAVALLAGANDEPQLVVLPTTLWLGESCGCGDSHRGS
jgi:LacI family transcriptional regulator